MKLKQALLAALRGDPELVPKVTESLRKRIEEEEGAMATVVQAAEALSPIIEESVRKKPSRLNRLGLKSAHLLASLADEDAAAGQRLAEMARDSTVGIVFVDVSGFTTFTAAEGDRAASELLGKLEPLVFRCAKLGKGEVVKHLGDGFLLAFPSASQAVRAAIALREQVRSERAGEDGILLPVRVAVHAGEPLVEEGDLLGHDVNLTARLLDHCAPDEIIVSDPAKAMAEKRLKKARFRDRRRVKIRGLTTPAEVWTVEPVSRIVGAR